MCTLSAAQGFDKLGSMRNMFPSLVLGFNRDEKKLRPAELPPHIRVESGCRLLAPTDPQSTGTWLAVNEYGLFFALLNLNLDDKESQKQTALGKSRGHVIPSIWHSRTLRSAKETILQAETVEYRPFRLVVLEWDFRLRKLLGFEFLSVGAHSQGPVSGASGNLDLSTSFKEIQEKDLPYFRTSFGGNGGDSAVKYFRDAQLSSASEKFKLFAQAENATLQEAENFRKDLHFSSSRENPPHSILMERSDARTTSVSFLNFGSTGITWKYLLNPFVSQDWATLELPWKA